MATCCEINRYYEQRQTYFGRTELAEFDDAMRQRRGGSERERRVTVEVSEWVEEGGV